MLRAAAKRLERLARPHQDWKCCAKHDGWRPGRVFSLILTRHQDVCFHLFLENLDVDAAH